MGHEISAAMDCRRRRRRENCRNFSCLSPRSIFSCWFSFRKLKGTRILKGHFYNEEDKRNELVMRCMHGESSSVLLEESGQHEKEAPFHLGVGLGPLYLTAASKCEHKKMVELCKQMETLLQDFKAELQNQRNNTLSTPSESNITISCSTSEAQEQVTQQFVSLQEFPSSIETENSDVSSTCGQNYKKNMNLNVENIKMEQLEAEVEAELEHLEQQLDTEFVPKYSNQKYSEIVVEDSALEETERTIFGEVFDQLPEVGNMDHHGVPPNELERRLHELLEERQQGEIKELKFSLECAMDMLSENHRELSWWKETTNLVFQHIPLRRRHSLS